MFKSARTSGLVSLQSIDHQPLSINHLKPTKYFIYRHIITLSILILLGLRFGKLKGVLIVLVVYLALNIDFVRWVINSYKRNSRE